MDLANENLIVAKGKTVNSVSFPYSNIYDPRYRLRKNAKINNINIEIFEAEGTVTKKKRTITVEAQVDQDGVSTHLVSTYKLNKRGQIIECTNNSSYEGVSGYKFKYDKNGNYIEVTITSTSDTVQTNYCEYDARNNLVKTQSTNNSGEAGTYIEFEYDAAGNRTVYSVKYASGDLMFGVEYTYDKKGRCTEEYNARYDIRTKYTYDSVGRYASKVHDNKGNVTTTEYTYDKNGLLSKTLEKYSNGQIVEQDYVYDYSGANVYVVSMNLDEYGTQDNSTRFGYLTDLFIGDYPVYEDGFHSPVNHQFNKAFLEESGFTVVSSTEELINAIKPGAGIIIAPGYYNMSEYLEELDPDSFNKSHKYVKLNKNYDGYELVIDDVDDLMISGGYADPDETMIVIDPRYSAVFRFEDCDGLQLNSFTAGHTKTGTCVGNVIDLYNCKNVGIYHVDLFGCGVYGLGIYMGSGDIRVYNSCIHDCEYGIFEMYALEGKVTFKNCLFYGSNSGGYLILMSEGEEYDVTFERCSFGEGETNGLCYNEGIECIDCLWSEVTFFPEWG